MTSSVASHTNSVSDVTEPRARRLLFVYQFLTGLYWVAVLMQIFFAGATIFVGGVWRDIHIGLGHALASPLPLVPLSLIMIAFIAHLPRITKRLSALLFVLTLIQPYLVFIRQMYPLVAAFHPVNAMVLFTLPLYMLAHTRHD